MMANSKSYGGKFLNFMLSKEQVFIPFRSCYYLLYQCLVPNTREALSLLVQHYSVPKDFERSILSGENPRVCNQGILNYLLIMLRKDKNYEKFWQVIKSMIYQSTVEQVQNDPVHVGLPPPRHQLESELDDTVRVSRTTRANFLSKQQNAIYNNGANVNKTEGEEKAVKFWHALKIPGVVESSVALFFSKLVIYSFLFWLPFYVKNNKIGGHCLTTFQSAALSSTFDVGAMIGSIIAGSVSDVLRARAVTSVASLVFAIPSLFLFRELGSKNLGLTITLMIITGIFVSGPYAMITTAVSADLGTHKSLRNNQKAKATVTAIIDGTGSIGGAVGPLLTGVLVSYENLNSVFYLFMSSSLAAALVLSRLAYREVKMWKNPFITMGQIGKDKKRRNSNDEFISDLHNEEAKLIH